MKRTLFLTVFVVFVSTIFSQDLYDYLERRGVEAIRDGDFLTAKEFLDTAIVLFPDSSELYFHRGGNYLLEDSLLQAKRDFETFINKKPNDIKVRSYYGFVLHGLGDTTKARINYESYLQHDPNDIEVLVNLARLDWLQNKKKQSEERMARVFKLKPKINNTARLYAQFLESNEAYEKAEKYYSKAIKMDSLDKAAYKDRSVFYFHQNEKEKCCKDLKTIIEFGGYEVTKSYNELDCRKLLGEKEGKLPPPPPVDEIIEEE